MLNHKQERQALLIFEAALDQPPSAQRAWVSGQRGGNHALETRVLSLLNTGKSSAAVALLTGHFVASASDKVPLRVGPYRITDQLGAGGMGVVYRDNGTFSRTVAIKFIHEIGVGPEVVARFHSERQILAAMQHPNIAHRMATINDLPNGFVFKFWTESLVTHCTSFYTRIIARKCPSNPGHSTLRFGVSGKPGAVQGVEPLLPGYARTLLGRFHPQIRM